ncbi:MAG: agmatine deiminase [Alphaproteobacteria bacterium]|jgi:agmatine deiminase|nr:agmatine deiminase [Alphaproteobacteria bacterium]
MTAGPPPPPPPEWASQSALWVGWPRLPGEWGTAFEPARTEIAAFARALAGRTRLRVAAGDETAIAAARESLGGCAQIRAVPTGDIWLRDTGPVFSYAPGGALLAHCFRFNGWGGRFEMPGDTETAAAIAEAEGARARLQDFILEGGAVEHDGAGTVITTRECLLNPNRNSGWTEADAEAALEAVFAARRVVWLDRGLLNDHTDGHVDNLARFCGPGRVVCQRASGADDPNSDRLAEIEARLRAAGLDVFTVPSPGFVPDAAGRALPASHLNFVTSNGLLAVPDYAARPGEGLEQAFAAAFPGMTLRRLSSRAILSGGGSFHCMTCHVPAPAQGVET